MQLQTLNIGNSFKEYRKKRGLTLRSASEKLGLNHSFLDKIERNQKNPSLENLKKIGIIYGMPLEVVDFIANILGYETNNYAGYKSYNVDVDNKYLYSKSKRRGVEKERMDDNLSVEPSFNVDAGRTPVLYADTIYLKSNENGIVLDIAQQLGPTNQFNIVARIGISKEHATRLIEQLDALLRSQGSRSTKKDN